MSGKLQEIRVRIKAVKDTQQITKAMKMVSASKLRRAQDRITTMRPYADKLNEMLSNIMANVDEQEGMAFNEERPVNNALIILITSDKGLCGGYNSNLAKLVKGLVENKYASQSRNNKLTLLCIGKKGYDAFKKSDIKINNDNVDLLTRLDYSESLKVSEHLLTSFLDKEYDAIELVYSKFKNAATQLFTADQFLPVVKIEAEEVVDEKSKTDYIFEPTKEEILNYLIPFILKTLFFRSLLDANASEHGARMTAMDKATENAEDLMKDLRIFYNRARQEEITKELTEIVGGADALAGG